MEIKFESIIKPLSKLFGIRAQTLELWAEADNRETHRKVLSSAYQAMEVNKAYQPLVESDITLFEIAATLGFDNPVNLKIEKLSHNTFRSWFDKPERKKLVVGFLLGLHWQLISEAARESKHDNEIDFLKSLDSLKVSPGEFVRLYQVSPNTMINLTSKPIRR